MLAEENAARPEARRRPQRNPAFSKSSQLVVLRDDPESVATRRPATNMAAQPPLEPQDSPQSVPPRVHGRDVHASALHSLGRTPFPEPPPMTPSLAHPMPHPPTFFAECFPNHSERPVLRPPRAPASCARPSEPAPSLPSSGSTSSLESLAPMEESAPAPPPTRLFATDVRVRGWHRVGPLMQGWVVYEIHITTRTDTVIRLSKRYSTFVSLHDHLAHERYVHARDLPALPPRHVGIWQRYHPTFLEERRRALQQWLCLTLLDERWGDTHAYTHWILER